MSRPSSQRNSLGGLYARRIKRPLDFAVALIGLIVASVPMLLVAILIKTTSRGPILRSHTRIGRSAAEFTLYKFRSMYIDAPIVPSADLDPTYITPIGKIIRKTSIDELPQLLNVLKGDMSLIGYRPVITSETWLNEARERAGVFRARPGITGLAQVSGRDAVSWQKKAKLDKKYVSRITFLSDLKILAKSFTVILVHNPETHAAAANHPQPRAHYQQEEVNHEH